MLGSQMRPLFALSRLLCTHNSCKAIRAQLRSLIISRWPCRSCPRASSCHYWSSWQSYTRRTSCGTRQQPLATAKSSEKTWVALSWQQLATAIHHWSMRKVKSRWGEPSRPNTVLWTRTRQAPAFTTAQTCLQARGISESRRGSSASMQPTKRKRRPSLVMSRYKVCSTICSQPRKRKKQVSQSTWAVPMNHGRS